MTAYRRLILMAGLAGLVLLTTGPGAGRAPAVPPALAAAQHIRADPAPDLGPPLRLPGPAPQPTAHAARPMPAPAPDIL